MTTTATKPATIPGPGIHANISAEVYHSWPGASNSRMNDMLRSPAHCYEQMTNPGEPTEAMQMGTAIHYAVLEPDLFETVYTVAGRCCAVKKSGERCDNGGIARAAGRWYCGVHLKSEKVLAVDGDINVLEQARHEQCLRIRDAVWAHPAAMRILGALTYREASLVWDDPETNVRCKLRADGISKSLSVNMDLKTTIDASQQAFTRSIFNFGYHRQGAHGLSGLGVCGLPVEHFVICAVEKQPPYAVAVYRLDDAAIEAGQKQLRPLIERFAQCQRTGIWPAYSDQVQDITLPDWAWRKVDADL